MRRAGISIAIVVVIMAALAPWLSPNDPREQYRTLAFAPPMTPSLGSTLWPEIHPLQLADPLTRRFVEDQEAVPLVLFSNGHLLSTPDPRQTPWFPLGADALGRCVFTRLLHGARLSMGVAIVGSVGALLLGALVGGLAGAGSGRVDELVMRGADLVAVLPMLYVVLVLRSGLPLVLGPLAVFVGVAVVLSLVGWPSVARGVRGLVVIERGRDHVQAARAVGASPLRVLTRHLLPATVPFLGAQALVLFPAFVLAEATLSYVGLGFAPPAASWGNMLQDASSLRMLADFPWLLAPALAISVVVFAINLALDTPSRVWPVRARLPSEPSRRSNGAVGRHRMRS